MNPVGVQQTIESETEQFWKEIFESYFHVLVQYAHKFVDLEVARDIVADVFTGMIEKRRMFEGAADAKKYCYTSVKHACFKYLDKEKRATLAEAELGNFFPDMEQRSVVFLHEVLTIREVLNKLMTHLNPQEDSIIRMFYFDKLSIGQIAEALQTSENSIRVQKSKAIKKMREADNGLFDALVYSILLIMSGLSQ
jgi:RNA polymerase sigma-70 factor (ECF subfamily)